MANSATQHELGSGYIRVVAKVLNSDFNDFKARWQAGLNAALNGVQVNSQIIDPNVAQQQGQQAGQQIGQSAAQGAQQAVNQAAPQVVAPIAAQGPSLGSALGAAIVSGVIAHKTGELIAKSFETASELNDAGNRLQASLGLSAEDAAKYGKAVGTLYADGFGDSIEDVQNSVASVISSIPGMRGASNEAVEDMTKKVLTLSDAFEIDAGRSTQVLGQLVKSGLVKDIDEGTDLITSSLQKVPANLREDILDAADEYAPFFKSVGLTGTQAFSALTAASDKGMYGIDKTGDAIKEFGIRATDMSKNTQTAYQTIGLSAQEYTQKLLAGGPTAQKAFQDIVKGLENIQDPATRANTAISLFGTPLEDLGVQQIPTFLQSLQSTNSVLGETAGSTDKATKALKNSMGNTLEGVKRQFAVTFCEIALPVLKAILPVVKNISWFIKDNKDMIQAVGGPLLVIAAVLSTVVFALNAYSIVAGVLGPLITSLAAAQWTFNAAALANPVFLWVAGIAAVILGIMLLITHWKEVTDFIISSINVVGGWLKWLGGLFSDIFGGIGGFFSKMNLGGIFGGFSVPMFAEGGLVTGPTLGILGEAGQNEIVMNEGAYNKQSAATVELIKNVSDNGTGGGNTQHNEFHGVQSSREMTALMISGLRQLQGKG